MNNQTGYPRTWWTCVLLTAIAGLVIIQHSQPDSVIKSAKSMIKLIGGLL